jgi:hypothetical protein
MYASPVRTLVLVLALLLTPATVALAQSVGPIPPFAFDIRGFYSGLGQDPVTAAGLGVGATDLPSRGLGGAAGIHAYPLRLGRLSVGLSGEGVLARGRAQREAEEGQPPEPAVQQRIQGLSGNVSLNFGDSNGWSYVTAGMGPMVFKSWLGETAPDAVPPRKMTINMGGGARWFFSPRMALGFDVRFYLTRPEDAVEAYPGRQRTRLLVLSGALSLK